MKMFNKKTPKKKEEPKEAVAVATPCKETTATKIQPTFRFRIRDGHLKITEALGGSFPDDDHTSYMGYKYTTDLSRSDAKVLLEFLLENRDELQ